MDFLSILEPMTKDLSPGRMLESLIVFFVVWNRLKPHLKKIEDRLEGVEKAVNSGFNSGSIRFTQIENRLEILENNKNNPIGGVSHGKTI